MTKPEQAWSDHGSWLESKTSIVHVSKKEFLKCIGTCKKEARETKHFLRMVARAVPELQADARELGLEARALHLIFARIWRTGKEKE
jgi:hypothetical protein